MSKAFGNLGNRKRLGSHQQASLPLANSGRARQPNSKLVFQLKTELQRMIERDREWRMMFQIISHDLKEPLLTLEGFTKMLADSDSLSKDQGRYLRVIREAVSNLHMLVGSLQSLARLSSDSPEISLVSLKQVLESVATSLSEQIKRTKGVLKLPDEELILPGDPVRLYQVFLNLIANSLKFHRKDSAPVISVRYSKVPRFYKVSIEDNGIGIEKKDLVRIFAPFTRLDEMATEGAGLGLSIVKRIVESLGGRVSVRSRHQKGTTFTVFLPRAEAK